MPRRVAARSSAPMPRRRGRTRRSGPGSRWRCRPRSRSGGRPRPAGRRRDRPARGRSRGPGPAVRWPGWRVPARRFRSRRRTTMPRVGPAVATAGSRRDQSAPAPDVRFVGLVAGPRVRMVGHRRDLLSAAPLGRVPGCRTSPWSTRAAAAADPAPVRVRSGARRRVIGPEPRSWSSAWADGAGPVSTGIPRVTAERVAARAAMRR
jgi:hypothetical protein